MGAGEGGRSSYTQLEDKLDAKVCQICLEFRKVIGRIIRGDTTSNEEMSNIERQATWKSSGINSGSARTVTEIATAYATKL